MDNQHRKIKTYRELSQEEIDLINEIKQHAEKTDALLKKINLMRQNQHQDACEGIQTSISFDQSAESIRCLGIAKEHLQTGHMWFVRAVALPDGF